MIFFVIFLCALLAIPAGCLLGALLGFIEVFKQDVIFPWVDNKLEALYSNSRKEDCDFCEFSRKC